MHRACAPSKDIPMLFPYRTVDWFKTCNELVKKVETSHESPIESIACAAVEKNYRN